MANQEKKKGSLTEQWKNRAGRTWEHEVPSGLKVVLRRPAWLAMLKLGLIPDHLFNLAMGVQESGKPAVDEAAGVSMKARAELMQAYAVASCVEPKVVLANPKPDEICVDMIDDHDLVSIFNRVQELLTAGEDGEGKALEPFRNGSDVANAGSGSAEIQPAPVGVAGDK